MSNKNTYFNFVKKCLGRAGWAAWASASGFFGNLINAALVLVTALVLTFPTTFATVEFLHRYIQ